MSILVTSLAWKYSLSSGSNLLVLLAISDFADDDGVAYPSIATLATKARISERTVQYALQQLNELGELTVESGTGPRGTNTYNVRISALRGDAQPAKPNPQAPKAGKVAKHRRVILETDPRRFVAEPELLTEWALAYPAVDVLGELLRAAVWLDSNPRRYTDWQRFLTNWLASAQKGAAGRARAGATAPRETAPQRAARERWEGLTGEKAAPVQQPAFDFIDVPVRTVQ